MINKRISLPGLIVSGFMILLPLLLLGLALVKMYELVVSWLRPFLEAMPGIIIRDPTTRFLAVALLIVLLFLLVGAVARTAMGRIAGQRIEFVLLHRFPLYSLLRTLASGRTGRIGAVTAKPVLVTVDDPGLEQFGFIIESHVDGRFTVFLPSSPNPSSGTTVIVGNERLQELEVPARNVLTCLSRWGYGSAALLQSTEQDNASISSKPVKPGR